MPELIRLHDKTLGGDVVQTVNSRELHEGLEITRDYTSWVKYQIQRAHLVEERDFTVFTNFGENPGGGRPHQDYYFTLRSAQHVAMMSHSKKAEAYRDYLLDCEQRLLALHAEENQHPLVRQARAIARLETRQAAVEARVDQLEAHEPPKGKRTILDWLRSNNKGWAGKDLRQQMHSYCKRLETPEPFTPKGILYPWWYFSPETIAAAWHHVTRQMTFLVDPGVAYRLKRKKKA